MTAAFVSDWHPHEPEIPPALDDEGRCWVCHLTVETQELRHALKTVRAECDLPDHIEEIVGDAIAFGNVARAGREPACRCVSGHHTCGLPNPEEELILALARVEELEDALRQIAAPKRPDGTHNLSREACEQLARKTLQIDRYQDADPPHNKERPRDVGAPGAAT